MKFLRRRGFYMVATIVIGCVVLCIGAAARVMAPELWLISDTDLQTAVASTEEPATDIASETEETMEETFESLTTDCVETEPPFVEDVSPWVTESIETEPVETEPPVTEPPVTEHPVTEQFDPAEIPTYDASSAVALSPAVGDDYFNDALFIGNSLMVGFSRSVNINTTYFVTIGLSVQSFFSKPFIVGEGEELLTASQALETVEFSKVYLMFGANELAWPSPEGWAGIYGSIIDRIYEVNPNAVVYVQSVLPICREKYMQSPEYKEGVTNAAAVRFNELLIAMCRDRGAHFVNVAEAVRTEKGELIPEATGDGLHLNYTYCGVWLEYLKTHTVS